jgi:hypothetical protein
MTIYEIKGREVGTGAIGATFSVALYTNQKAAEACLAFMREKNLTNNILKATYWVQERTVQERFQVNSLRR